METIGFIGLGTMGAVMARRLRAAGYDMTVWNRTGAKAESLVKEGAQRVVDITSLPRRSRRRAPWQRVDRA